MNHWKRTILHSTIAFFALIGFGVFVLFIAHSVGLTNVSGLRSEARSLDKNSDPSRPQNETVALDERLTICLIDILKKKDPETTLHIEQFLGKTHNWSKGSKMVSYAINHADDENLKSQADSCTAYSRQSVSEKQDSLYPWIKSKEWGVLQIAFDRDKDLLNSVATQVDISPRLIIGPVMGEQLRYFSSARGAFESYFEPVKQFIHLSKFSYGVAGMKPETAKFIEGAIKTPSSPFYLGQKYETMLDYPEGSDIETERMNRLNNQKDHTYPYLYVALAQKMLITQWGNAGFDISEEPGVLATLYNLGFYRSKPHEAPGVGGASITIEEKTYSFGQLAEQFYWSGEMEDIFLF